ncbi:MAG: coenzyme F430 synthase [Methanohalobium sp.]|uniref:coenzyme F430 synthase n=1 Tax=Methanohalobium sp. TaxID=2837493 RepID=UPI003979CCD9
MIAGKGSYKNIAVLDLTHGGVTIAKKLSELGYNVYAVDVYNTVDAETLSYLQINSNISTFKEPFFVDNLDLLIAPVHLDPDYPMLVQAYKKGVETATHHKIVGDILSRDKRVKDAAIIEITGTKGKTSTASILADILSRRMNVILHTSQGLEFWKNGLPERICNGLSITPGNILQVVDMSLSKELNPDAYVFEVSLGGTGLADMGIITTLNQDFTIANGTKQASSAKLEMIDNAKLNSKMVINSNAKEAILCSRKKHIKTFEFNTGNVPDNPVDLNLMFDNDGIIIKLQDEMFSIDAGYGYDIESYTTAVAAAVSAAHEMNVEFPIIKKTLIEFSGLKGRMREQKFSNGILIDNSNSGMDAVSAEKSLDYALRKKCSGKIVMIMGEESAQVCEGLFLKNVHDFVERRNDDIDQLILVGERLCNIKHEDAYYTSTLDEGLKVAFDIADKYLGSDNLIISSVKCFR